MFGAYIFIKIKRFPYLFAKTTRKQTKKKKINKASNKRERVSPLLFAPSLRFRFDFIIHIEDKRFNTFSQATNKYLWFLKMMLIVFYYFIQGSYFEFHFLFCVRLSFQRPHLFAPLHPIRPQLAFNVLLHSISLDAAFTASREEAERKREKNKTYYDGHIPTHTLTHSHKYKYRAILELLNWLMTIKCGKIS